MSNSQIRRWDIRANADYYTAEELTKFLDQIASHWVFQKEKGEKGYVHWQGRMKLWDKRGLRKKALMNLMDKIDMKVPNYLRPTSNPCKDFRYPMKASSRIDGPYSNKDKPAYIPKQFQLEELRDWQKQVLETKDQWDTRAIHVLINHEGNIGKSTLAHWARLNEGAMVLPPMNDCDKIVQSACCMAIAKQQRKSCMVFFDIPRSVPQNKLASLFAGIEIVKSGYLYDWRHKFKFWDMNSPVVWIFMNQRPRLAMLTSDRWKLYELEGSKLKRVSGASLEEP